MFDIIFSINEFFFCFVVLYIIEGDKEDYNLVGDILYVFFKWLVIFFVLLLVYIIVVNDCIFVIVIVIIFKIVNFIS